MIRAFVAPRDKYLGGDEEGVDVEILAALWRVLRPGEDEEFPLAVAVAGALQDYSLVVPEEQPGSDNPILLSLLTSRLLERDDISKATKARACMELFHSIPLPEREDEAFLTHETVPRGLQEAALFLLLEGEFVEYHLLHLIYALYLDPGRAADAPLEVLEGNLRRVLEQDLEESLKMLYAYLLLSVPSLDSGAARGLMSAILDSPAISEEAKRSLCLAALDRSFGLAWFSGLAAAEGLFPREREEAELLKEIRVRPLPEVLSSLAEGWLLRSSEKP